MAAAQRVREDGNGEESRETGKDWAMKDLGNGIKT